MADRRGRAPPGACHGRRGAPRNARSGHEGFGGAIPPDPALRRPRGGEARRVPRAAGPAPGRARRRGPRAPAAGRGPAARSRPRERLQPPRAPGVGARRRRRGPGAARAGRGGRRRFVARAPQPRHHARAAAAPGRGRAAPAPGRRALRRGHRRSRRAGAGALRAGQARRVRRADAHRAEGGGELRPAAAGGPGVPGGLRASRRRSRTAADEHAEGRPRVERRLTGAYTAHSFMAVPKALTVAGSDSGGGAGIQADLKTFSAVRVFGMSVLTAVTAQNSVGVTGVHDLPPEFVARQLDAVLEDFGADAVKLGMLSTAAIIHAVAKALGARRQAHVVLDPVMIAKSGDALLQPQARAALVEAMLPLADVVTPNL